MTGTIVTFYSYKGGTGRTMALANIGWILASNGNKVLLIDWDLEAPGLHHYFQRFLASDEAPPTGLIDFFWDLAAYAADPATAGLTEQPSSMPNLREHVRNVNYRFPRKGSIVLVRAGREDRLFSLRVQDFDWKHFYEDLGGESLLETVREDLKQEYDWILIDSRTGLSDTSGICTVKMPDILVNCFVPNRQSIEGARAVADSVVAQRKDLIRIFPLPCRIENAEHKRLEQTRSTWRRQHQGFLDDSIDPENYWGSVEVPYRTIYAFEESLATLIDRPRQVDTVLAACERFTSFITDGMVRELIQPSEGEGVPVKYRSAVLAGRPPRVFLSYSHDDPAHEELVREFWIFLRTSGIDARLDLPSAERRADWAQWMTQQIRDADYVLVIASAAYRRGDDAAADASQGLAQEIWLVRDAFYADQAEGLRRIVPVVLPGCSSDDLPLWLRQTSASYSYLVSEFTARGAESLLRLLTSQPAETEPPLGLVPDLPPVSGTPGQDVLAATALRTKVLIEADVTDNGQLISAVWLSGSMLCQQQVLFPPSVARVWDALRLPPRAAAERMASAGRRLASALMDDSAQRLIGLALGWTPPGGLVEVVLSASPAALSLPVELIRVVAGEEFEVGPLALLPQVTVSRRLAAPSQVPGRQSVPETAATARAGLPGPLKVLVAVAAPDETKTSLPPLDVEAEMQAILDAVSGVAEAPQAQVRILEVASLPSIQDAMRRDAYHILHLSAHGSATSVELEDEDGAPVAVTPRVLMQALSHAGRPVPLIVSHTGGSADSLQMGAGLITHGADRVITLQAALTDNYAAALGRHFYRELAAQAELTVGQALSRARYLAEEDRAREPRDGLPAPEYGVATLVTAGADDPLVDPAAPADPLTIATLAPSGRSVRELPIDALIGRRAQLRKVMSVLRRTPEAVQRFGVASGVQVTGVAGIGKTAFAGRVIARLRAEGWLIAVHEGRWNPTELIRAIALAVEEAALLTDDPRAGALRSAQAMLTDPDLDDGPKLAAIALLLSSQQLLVVFDDFEQNLSAGGATFLDPTTDQVITGLADAADVGALLLTSRYPLPGPDRFLVQVPIPALSAAELQRLYLRLPALHDLDAEDQRLLSRTIGGNPRLIEFADALLRGGRASLKHVQVKLRELARAEGLSLEQDRSPEQAFYQAMLLGSADILFGELQRSLSPQQDRIMLQVAVCRAAMTIDDLAFTLASGLGSATADPVDKVGHVDMAALRADVDRLVDLTLLAPGDDIAMQPWTAELVTRSTEVDLGVLHERALAMRLRRFQQGRGSYDDLIDIPRHLAALHRYDDVAAIAQQAIQVLPGTMAITAYLAEVRPQIPLTERAWIVIADLEVQALLREGDLASATRQLRALHLQVEVRAFADPTNSQRQRDLSVSHGRLGDVALAAGDLTAARTAYQASLDIAAQLAAADPANTEWQRDLSVSHSRLGDVAFSAGDLTAARASYQAGLDIRERLAAADPGNSQWQRDLSVSYIKLGDVAGVAGDVSAARAAYQAALDIATRLAAADPGNTEWQRDLSVSHSKLGDVALSAGDPVTARAAYQAALDIRERLAAADPANVGWQRDLSVSYSKVGDVALSAGDLVAARAAYQAALDIAIRLVTADPGNTEWQRDLSVSHSRLGDVALSAGDLVAARAAYQAALDIAARLAAADPANILWQRDLFISRERFGNVSRGESRGTTDVGVPEESDVQDSLDATEDQQFVTEQSADDRLRLPNATTSASSEPGTGLQSPG